MEALAEELPDYPADLIQGAGRNIWLAFRKWVELEDCQQEAWVCYLTYRAEFDQHLADGKQWYVAKAIRNWVSDWCRRQKAVACGYSVEDEQFYSRRRVRTLLEHYLCGEHLPQGGPRLEGKIKTAATDGTETTTELLDIERAWLALDDGPRDALRLAYGPVEPPPGGLSDMDRQKARRALGRLLDLLHGVG